MDLLAVPESLTILTALAVLGVGLVAGFLNVTAGGGSLLAMPMLIFLGLPPTVANGTTRIAILAQNAAAIWRYRRGGKLDLDIAKKLVPPTLIGAAAGAALGSFVPDLGFKQVLGWVMIGAAILVIVGPGRLMQSSPERARPWWVWWAVFLLVGFYGGFIQAAVGYLLLAALTFVVGMELVEANIMKVVLVFAYTPLALGVFVANDKVALWPGLLLAVGQSVGGWIAAAVALERGASFIRAMLAIAVALTGVKLLFF